MKKTIINIYTGAFIGLLFCIVSNTVSFYENKRVLVSGGYGFIGSHLVEKLVKLGAHVTVLDNMSTGKEENLCSVASSVRSIRGDIRVIEDCMEAAGNQDIIFHLAAEISVVQSLLNPVNCFDSNVIGTWNLLEAARISGVSRFIFSSSASVYGNHEGICTESDVCSATSAYGLSKYMGEQLVAYYCRTYGLLGISLRYFNAYGLRQDPTSQYAGVVAKFTQLLHEKKPLTIFGDGLQTRDFVSVDHIVDMNITSGLLAPELLDGSVCNVATGKSITLLDLIHKLCNELDVSYTPEIIFNPAREGEIRTSQANCQKMNQLQASLKN